MYKTLTAISLAALAAGAMPAATAQAATFTHPMVLTQNYVPAIEGLPILKAANVNLRRIPSLGETESASQPVQRTHFRTEQEEPNLNFNLIDKANGSAAKAQVSQSSTNQSNTEKNEKSWITGSSKNSYPSDSRNQYEPNINFHQIDKAKGAAAGMKGTQSAMQTPKAKKGGWAWHRRYYMHGDQHEPNINLNRILNLHGDGFVW